MLWVSRLLSNNNDMKSQPAWPHRLIGHFRQASLKLKTKVVKVVTNESAQPGWLALHIILIKPNLLTLSIWIQITIHPLSTDGAIVI